MRATTPETLCVVMPAYNEQACIEGVILGWLGFLQAKFAGPGNFLLVVDDGSRDNTGGILDRLAAGRTALKVIHQTNGGHGRALLAGYRAALALAPMWVFQVDSDDQFLPGDFDKLWVRRHESNFITGYRKVRTDALHRLIITRIVVAANFLLFGRHFKDANIPYRLMRASYLEIILNVIPENPFAPNIFLAVVAAKDGQRLLEIPISHQQRKTGTVSIVRWKLIRVCLRSAGELLRFRRSLRAGLRSVQRSTAGQRHHGD